MNRETAIPAVALQQEIHTAQTTVVSEVLHQMDQNVATSDENMHEVRQSTEDIPEQVTDSVAAEQPSTSSRTPPQSPSVREIHKNSWLKKMPSVDKWSGRFTKVQKAEKFWVVFCVHDDQEAFLEFYENRRSAYSHKPLSSISLAHCLHISPTIVVQENDHEFVITLDTQIVRLAASTREQMLEWMDTMRTKLRELGVLEPKDNLYSREPIITPNASCGIISVTETFNILQSQVNENSSISQSTSHSDLSRFSLRDPNSPLPPVPANLVSSIESRNIDGSNATVIYIRNPPSMLISSQTVQSSALQLQQETNVEAPAEERTALQSTSSNIFNFDFVSSALYESNALRQSESITSQDSAVSVPSPNSSPHTAFSVPSTPILEQCTPVYEPLFYSSSLSGNRQLTSRGIRNPNYENPRPQVHSVSEIAPVLPPRMTDQRRMSSSMVNDIQEELQGSTMGLNHLSSNSEPSLNAPVSSGANSRHIHCGISDCLSSAQVIVPSSSSRTRVLQESSRNVVRAAPPPLDEGPPPYNSIGSPTSHQRNSQSSNFSADGASPVDEMGRPLSLREAQVLKLQKEIIHKSGVRLMLRKKDCINAIALVECFGSVWIAGWKQKEHPLLHNTFHIGDRIMSISGHRIQNVQEANKAIKHQPLIVEFVVRRTPHGKVLAIKREYESQDLGIIREGGTAEIKEVKPGGLVSRHGLLAKAPSVDGNLCNWILTEINHRPLNLFFKDNEVQDRLNAVGLDISILVQPVDLVKTLKKQLKTLRGYKDYIVQ